jgi:hypothetical protein
MSLLAVAIVLPLQILQLYTRVALAFIPSSLMLGATAYITLNIAAIPLLWVIPLALYLLSFILVFAKWPSVIHRAMVVTVPLAILLLVFSLMPSGVTVRFWIIILLHLATLFVVALVCHGELARSRPPITHLTIFYLLMSVGGALGGIFNALIAPVVFNNIVEYQLVLVLAALVLPRLKWRSEAKESDGVGLSHNRGGVLTMWAGSSSWGLSPWDWCGFRRRPVRDRLFLRACLRRCSKALNR